MAQIFFILAIGCFAFDTFGDWLDPDPSKFIGPPELDGSGAVLVCCCDIYGVGDDMERRMT